MAIQQTPQKPGLIVKLYISPTRFRVQLLKILPRNVWRQVQVQQDPSPLPSTHLDQLDQHRQLHPLYSPENLPILSDTESSTDRAFSPPTSTCTTHWPHLNDTFNAVSAHYLSSTSFATIISMSRCDEMRAKVAAVDTCFARIHSAVNKACCPPLIASEEIKLDEVDYDIDRVGILFEYGATYYVMFESTSPSSGVRGAFIPKSHLSPSLMYEWASLPKRRIGTHGIGATGQTSTSWHVHSAQVKALRCMCASLAAKMEVLRRGGGREKGSARAVGEALGRTFDVHLGAWWEGVRGEEERKKEEGREVWGEWMVDCDEGEEEGEKMGE